MTRSNTISGSAMFLIGLSVGVWLVLILVIVFSGFRPNYSEVGCKQKVAYSEDLIPFKGEVHKACWLHIGDKFYEIGCAPEEK